MARTAILACTLALCALLCSGRFVDFTQDDQPYEDAVVDRANTFIQPSHQSEGAIMDDTAPLVQVTVWKVGAVPAGFLETVSLAISNPFDWLLAQGDQSMAIPLSVRQARTDDIGDMLRRISCARMRQAMMDYYTYRKELPTENEPHLSEIRLTPFLMPQREQQDPGVEREDQFSTASLFDFPLRGGGSSSFAGEQDLGRSEDGMGPDGAAMTQVLGQGLASDMQQDVMNRGDELHNLDVDAPSSAGVQQLSSMLHTVSSLLSRSRYNSFKDVHDSLDRTLDRLDPASDSTTAYEREPDGYMNYGADPWEPRTEEVGADAWQDGRADWDAADKDLMQQTGVGRSEPEFMSVPQPLIWQDDVSATSSDGAEYDVFPTDPYEQDDYEVFDKDRQQEGRVQYDQEPVDTQDDWEQDMPMYYDDSVSFMEYSDDEPSEFDWPLFVFTLLAASCVVVWAVAVTQYVRLRAMLRGTAADHDLDDSDSVLAPLLEKVHAVEVAANHVDPDAHVLDTKTALLKAEYCPPQP